MSKQPRIAVFFAHMHQLHQVKVQCFHGVSVPFVYVGSVPNNRLVQIQVAKQVPKPYHIVLTFMNELTFITRLIIKPLPSFHLVKTARRKVLIFQLY